MHSSEENPSAGAAPVTAHMVTRVVTRMDVPPIPPIRKDGHPRAISPTDVSRFITLDQCERFLRLSLHARVAGRHFLQEQFGVNGQAIPPLLTQSGARFEERVEEAIRARYPVSNYAALAKEHVARGPDNARILQEVRALAPGEVRVYFQVRLHVDVAGWQIRGDADILRMERDETGALRVLIADMKSSAKTKVEHRLQVAFYAELLAALFAERQVACERIEMAILYRGPAATETLTPEDEVKRERDFAAAETLFGTRVGLLEVIADDEAYRASVRDLVTGEDGLARRVAEADFAALPYCLGSKCDGCRFNEFCLTASERDDDLSLLPHLGASEKSALRRAGVSTMRELAQVKAPTASEGGDVRLVPTPGNEALAQRLATTWPVGPRLDELVVRARRYRQRQGDDIEAPKWLPARGYGSLPYRDATHNPNLVRVYIDAQYDYLKERVYLLGALVAACENGEERADRRRAIVTLAERPPETAEQERALFLAWIRATITAVVELAAPDEHGKPYAPIHLIFFDRHDQRVLLDGLARHATELLGATALYDFLTQLAAYDSPIISFLSEEIRELKNYPLLCQSLQAVGSYLRFDWNAPAPYRTLFRARLFDSQGRRQDIGEDIGASGGGERDEVWPWYTRRARFNSNIPLEYAYAAWGELPDAPATGTDDYRYFRVATPELLRGFQARRLEALEHITHDFKGNKQTQKTAFLLPDLERFQQKAETLAQALKEFISIERHAALGQWKAARLPAPERRVLAGDTLLARYLEEDQDAETVATLREYAQKQERRERLRAAYREANPDAKQIRLSKEERVATECSLEGVRLRLRITTEGVDCGLGEALALSTLRERDRVVVYPRWTTDERLPEAERTLFNPTPKQMLYGMRADLRALTVRRDAARQPTAAFVEVEIARSGFTDKQGFAFGGREHPLEDGALYTLDADPNDWYGYQSMAVTEGLVDGQPNTLYARLADPTTVHATWPEAARDGQRRFLAGLEALRLAGAMDGFEESKLDYIGGYGEAPLLVVQGPPGTGKSYTTAFAVFARLQGALAAGQPFRVFIACKTHAATDVLLAHVAKLRETLRALAATHPAIFRAHFDPRLLDEVTLFRVEPSGGVPEGVVALPKKDARGPNMPHAIERIAARPYCVVATTPGKVYRILKDRYDKDLYSHQICHCLILDEASQMNLPEAMMAALTLAEDGQLIVVGDHRQMPPIIKHDWLSEPRRTFQEYHSYDSLFQALLALDPPVPVVRFARSFRLHADMAEFLRREIYAQDGIEYYSERRETLEPRAYDDPFVASVLDPKYALVAVLHDEAASMTRNAYEQTLLTPILEALADPAEARLGPEHGLGVVVPHRAQRAALREDVPCLSRIDPRTGAITLSAVDTVERFQGDEREVIVVSATESDREYLLAAGEFLLDPRRLTVALSRAKHKMVLVASRSVFSLFSADEEMFANARLWKNLLRRTCTVKLWEGEREGHHVEVWGNAHDMLS